MGGIMFIFAILRFYRATRMHSADYAVARCPSVRLSVCLSVCLTHAGIESKRLYMSTNFFHYRVAPPFWFSRTKRGGNIPTATPITGASNARGMKKITIFDQYHALSRKWCNIEPELLWNAIETAPKLSNGTSLNDFEWPLTHVSRSWYHST